MQNAKIKTNNQQSIKDQSAPMSSAHVMCVLSALCACVRACVRVRVCIVCHIWDEVVDCQCPNPSHVSQSHVSHMIRCLLHVCDYARARARACLCVRALPHTPRAAVTFHVTSTMGKHAICAANQWLKVL